LGTFFELPNAVSFSALLDKENRLLEFGFCDESNFFYQDWLDPPLL